MIRTYITRDVIITRREDNRLGEFRWGYRMWDPKDGDPVRVLCSENDLPIYPGQRVSIGGLSKLYPRQSQLRFHVDQIRETPKFTVGEDDQVRLVKPKEGREPDSTFSRRLITKVNGRDIELGLPVVVNDVNPLSLSDGRVTVTEVQRYDWGYLLVARLPYPIKN